MASRTRTAAVYLAIAVATLGCKPCDPIVRVRTIEVKVPVAVPCPEPDIPEPTPLPIKDLTPDSPANTVAEAYAESIRLLQMDLQKLRVILRGYLKPVPKGASNGS